MINLLSHFAKNPFHFHCLHIRITATEIDLMQLEIEKSVRLSLSEMQKAI